jgi:phosphoglycerate dehydrogenase-like enzyme
LLRQTTTELPKRLNGKILGGLPAPKTLFQRRVTVVGFGAVGSVLCSYLTSMGAKVTVVRKTPFGEQSSSSTVPPNFQYGSNNLEEVLPNTEVLILACPVTNETFHLMNQERIGLLPKGAYLINVGRGPLVEYHAVRTAIESKHLAGFASDVGVGHPTKPSEPWDPEDPLTKHPNTIFTPHVGGYSEYSYGMMAEKVLESIQHIRKGKPPPVWCNETFNG